jgi:hypothetical protein
LSHYARDCTVAAVFEVKKEIRAYSENLTIAFDLRIVGSGAATTIIDGAGAGSVIVTSTTAT